MSHLFTGELISVTDKVVLIIADSTKRLLHGIMVPPVTKMCNYSVLLCVAVMSMHEDEV